MTKEPLPGTYLPFLLYKIIGNLVPPPPIIFSRVTLTAGFNSTGSNSTTAFP